MNTDFGIQKVHRRDYMSRLNNRKIRELSHYKFKQILLQACEHRNSEVKIVSEA